MVNIASFKSKNEASLFESFFKDWTIGMDVPGDIKWLYFVECGFYLHSIYASKYCQIKNPIFMVILMKLYILSTFYGYLEKRFLCDATSSRSYNGTYNSIICYKVLFKLNFELLENRPNLRVDLFLDTTKRVY